MDKWECLACGYIYDPAVGDPDNGVPAGTAFEDLPDDWVCPECGAEKDMFQKLEEESMKPIEITQNIYWTVVLHPELRLFDIVFNT